MVYVPTDFRLNEDASWAVVLDAGAGSLVIATPRGIESVFVPVVVSDDRQCIWAHVAKANPWWRLVRSGQEVLALFQAASAYVTPSYYPSRVDHPSVVPTWNYVAAEVRGTITLHDESSWKMDQVRELTEHFERARDPKWRIEEAPSQYLDQQLRAIVGLEIRVRVIEGKAKLSQNRPMVDRDTVREGLAQGTLAEQMVAQRMLNDD